MDEFYVTPIQQLNEKIDNNHVYIKREDLLPFSFGGNKARKAKLFFNDIEKVKADYVVTYGSGSSNHCRIIANMAAAKSLPCLIISPKEAAQKTYNTEMIGLFGAKTIFCPVLEVANTIKMQMEILQEKGKNPYFIMGGGHGNIGTQAYVECFEEILAFKKETGVDFDYIFHASGTGTTQSGLVCGKLLNNSKIKVVGISIARKNPYGRNVVSQSVNSYLESQGYAGKYNDAIEFIDDYVVDGYGTYNAEILDTIKKVMLQYGIPLDITYTGKAFWGMNEYLNKRKIQGKNILFLHTGGTPLFFDDIEKIK